MFTTFAAGLWLGRYSVGAAVVAAALAATATLEWAFDFCLGCWMYGLMISFGIVPKSIYRAFTSLLASRQWAYKFNNPKWWTQPKPTTSRVLLPGTGGGVPHRLHP